MAQPLLFVSERNLDGKATAKEVDVRPIHVWWSILQVSFKFFEFLLLGIKARAGYSVYDTARKRQSCGSLKIYNYLVGRRKDGEIRFARFLRLLYDYFCFLDLNIESKLSCESITAAKTTIQPIYSRTDIFSERSIAEPTTPKTDSSDIRIDAAAGFVPR